jgi:subtilisin-like proprotein convertase family protein
MNYVTYLLSTLAILLFTNQNTNCQTVALFFDPAYVDVTATCDGEAYNVEQYLLAQGYTVNTFTGTTQADWEMGLSGSDLVVVPELEGGLPPLTMGATAHLQNYLASGRSLLIFGSVFTDDFLNDNLNYSLLSTISAAMGTEDLLAAASNSCLNEGGGLAANLNTYSGTFYVDDASLPPGTNAIYGMTGANTNISVFEAQYGDGSVIYFGWDYFEGGPGCVNEDASWNAIIEATITECTELCLSGGPEFVLCPSNINVGNDVDVCEALVNYGILAEDPCWVSNSLSYEFSTNGGATWNPGTGSGLSYPVGVTSVEVRATNPDGMLSLNNCEIQITVEDLQNPTAVCTDNNVVVGANCEATVLASDVGFLSYDNCGISTLEISDDNVIFGASLSFTQADQPNSPITAYVRACDSDGNCETCTALIYLTDESAPTITCPADLTVNTVNGQCHGLVPDLMATVDDNCDVLTVSQSPAPGTAFGGAHGDVITVTITVEDIDGNLNTCDVDVELNDNQAPTANFCNLIDITIGTSEGGTGDCEANYTVQHPLPTDNCSIDFLRLNILNPDNSTEISTVMPGGLLTRNYDLGLTRLRYRAFDFAGNSTICITDVIVVDDEGPVMVCPADIIASTSDDGTGDCSTEVSWISPSPTDNCDVVMTVSYVVTDGENNTVASGMDVPAGGMVTETLMVGVYTVQYSSVDDSGNASTCTFEIEVIDDEDPEITCDAIPMLVSANLGECFFAVPDNSFDPIVSDNCSIGTLTHNVPTAPNQSTLEGASLPVGDNEVTWTLTDSSGNTVVCMVVITVADDESPIIVNCPGDQLVGTDGGICEAIVNFDVLIAEDNCTPTGQIVWEYSLDGGAWQSGQASGLTFPLGTTLVEHRATDTSGNISLLCSFDVIVNDDESPSVVCSPVQATVGADCDAMVTDSQIGGLSTDNCGIDNDGIRRAGSGDPFTETLSFTQADYVNSPINVEYQACDAAGNCAVCVTTVTLIDESLPVLDCPDDLTVNTEPGFCYGEVPDLMAAVSDDNCEFFTITQEPTAGLLFGSADGDILVVLLIIEDEGGNRDSCTVNVTLNDNEAPASNYCNLVDITLGTSTGGTGDCLANYTLQHPLPSDNCIIDLLRLNIINPDGSNEVSFVTPGGLMNRDYEVGLSRLRYRAFDEAGNSTVCVTDIFVVDDESPIVVCPTNATIGTDEDGAGDCSVDFEWVTPTPTDNCDTVGDITIDLVIEFADGTAIGAAGVTAGDPESAVFPIGESTVRYTVTDQSGNVGECSFAVVVFDNELPVITCAPDTVLATDAGQCEALITNNDLNPVSFDDNCGVDRIRHNYPYAPRRNSLRGATFYEGTTVVVWTVFDEAGNSANCEIQVTVEDNELPVFLNCPDSTIAVANDDGWCGAIAHFDQLIGSDNCTSEGDLIYEYSINNGPWIEGQANLLFYEVGSHTIDNRVTDASGNVSNICSIDLVVEDKESPDAICVPQVVVVGEDCDAVITAEQVGGLSTDNCEIASILIGLDTTNFGPDLMFDLEDYENSPITVYVEVCDIYENCSICATSVFLIDEDDPVVVCPDDITLDVVLDACYVELPDFAANYTDNCDVFDIVQIPAPGTNVGSFHGQEVPVMIIVTDFDQNRDTCEFSVTLNDASNPIITDCPTSATIGTSEGGTGDCLGAFSWRHPVPLDNCVIDSMRMRVESPDGSLTDWERREPGIEETRDFELGTSIVYFEAFDDAGNEVECVFSVTVEDDESPIIVCPPNVTGLVCGDEVPEGALNAAEFGALGGSITDNCSVDGFTVRYTDSDNYSSYCTFDGPRIVTRVYTVSDEAGNEARCEQEFIFDEDLEAPVISGVPGDTIVGCSDQIPPVPAVTAMDNCEQNEPIALDFIEYVSNDSCQDNFIITRQWTARDLCGNESIASYTVTIKDTIAPMIFNVPANDTVACQEMVPPVPMDVFATDNCNAPVFLQFNEVAVPFGCDDQYDLVRTWTAYDACGNRFDSSYVIAVRDTIAPIIVGGEDFEVSCEQNNANNDAQLIGWLNNNAGATATDNCSRVNWENNYSASNWVNGCGRTRYVDVTFYAYDECNNVDSAIFRFGTIDTLPPVFQNCPRLPIVENAEFRHCDAYVNFSAPLAYDNCSDSVFISQIDDSGLNSGDRFPVGTTILIFEATDQCGNASTCEYKVIVNDYWERPQINCPSDVEQINDLNECGAMVNDLSPTVGDMCPDNLLVLYTVADEEGNIFAEGFDDASGLFFPKGDNTVTYYVQDQPLLLITEVTQMLGADVGATDPVPAYFGGDLDNGDYIEITNFGAASIDLSCVSVEIVEAGGSVCLYTFPAATVIAPGEVAILHVGDGIDDAANKYFNANCVEADATSPRGYILSLYNRVIDVVTTNGLDPVGLGTTAIVGNDDWDGVSEDLACFGSYRRHTIIDGNTADDWELASACSPANLGTLNEGLTFAEDNGAVVSMQSVNPGVESCTVLVSIIDVEAPTCIQYDTLLYENATNLGQDVLPGACYESVISVADNGLIGEVHIWELTGSFPDMGEVSVSLISPEGTEVLLWASLCEMTADFYVNLYDQSGVPISDASCGPLGGGGVFAPAEAMKAFYRENSLGDWRLRVENNSCDTLEVGQVSNWELELLLMEPYAQTDTTIVNEPGLCGASFTWVHPVLEDNCCEGEIEVEYTSNDGIAVPASGPITGGEQHTGFFQVGTTLVTYTLTDASGNQNTCSFEVTVIDDESPVLTNCPGDVTVNLDPGACGVFYSRTYTTMDNCEIDSIVVSPSNGSYIEIGDTTICVVSIDVNGNQDTCKYTLIVNEFLPSGSALACNDQVNISLDGTCMYELNADVILEGNDYRCYENYLITLREIPSNRPHSSLLTIDDIGKCFQVTVTDPVSGNSCWGRLCVEDKQAPEIECPEDMTLACNEPIHPDYTGYPEVLSCEVNTNITYVDKITEFEDCDDIRIQILRKWRVVDNSGNRTECEQLLSVQGFDLSDVSFPRHYDDLDLPALACEERRDDSKDVSSHIVPFPTCVDGYLLDSAYFNMTNMRRPKVLGWNELLTGPNAGHPSPFSNYYDEHPAWSVRQGCWGPETHTKWFGTGTPTINGQSVYSNNAYCSLSVRYEDEVYEICGNTFEVLRHWKVRDMCRPIEVGVNPIEYIQVIKIIDREGPEIVYPEKVTVGMDPWQCLGTWQVPVPWIIDNCQDSVRYEIQTHEGRARQLPNGTWIVEGLPAGTYTILIIATDACHRRTTKKVEVMVVDDVPPVAVCEGHTVVSIPGGQGGADAFAKIEAVSFDDGSHDNCGPVYFKAVRMTKGACNGVNGDDNPNVPGYQEYPDDYVKFCCEDVGDSVLVRFLVFDVDPGPGPINESLLLPGRPLFGRYTECMVVVKVQNKEQPTVVAPPTIVVSCDFWFDVNSLTDPNDDTFGKVVTDLALREKVKTEDIVCPEWCEPNPKFNYFPPAGLQGKCALYDASHPDRLYVHEWGFDGYVLASCGSNITITVNDLRECGQGRITRTIRAPGQNGPVTATQTIYFVDCNPYFITDQNCFDQNPDDGVIWPCDVELTDCNATTTPNVTGRPTILNDDNCSLVAVGYVDEVFEVVPDACFKILRTWTIVDWCQYDPSVNPNEGKWVFDQIILVNDGTKPVFPSCEDVTFCDDAASIDPISGYCLGQADLVFDTIIDCTPYDHLVFEYKIDLFNDGDYDLNASEYGNKIANNPFAFNEDNARDASGRYPLGTHRIKWFVEDMCGNLGVCEYLFTVEDCKKPTPYCRTGIVTVVMPINGEVEVWAKDLDVGSFDNCPGDLQFHFDELGLESSRTFDCDDLGITEIEIWVTDAAGNKDFCTTQIEIQDPNDVCGSTIMATIEGVLNSTKNDPVANVDVVLYNKSNQVMDQDNSSKDGKYAFPRVPMGYDYSIRPEKNDDPMNGVSTRDLILIQRHLLGLEEFSDPMQLIAADVNNSKNVTAKDLVELRKLILGLWTGFDQIHPDQRSWRFMDATHIAANPQSPYVFPEHVEYNPLLKNELSTNFSAIKIGDVDGSAKANANSTLASRSDDQLTLKFRDMQVQAGDRVEVAITAADFHEIAGIQGVIELDNAMLQFVGVKKGQLEMSEDNLGMLRNRDGLISFSWHGENALTIAKDEVLFTLVVDAVAGGTISNSFRMVSGAIANEAYKGFDYIPIDLKLKADDVTADNYVLYQNVPNPFDLHTTIGFELPRAMDITLSIYDQNGKVLWLQAIEGERGLNSVEVLSKAIGVSGILYYQLDADSFTETKRMVIIR